MKSILVLSSCALLLTLSFCLEISAQSSISTLGRRMDEINKLGDKAVKDEMNRDLKRGQKPSKEQLRRAAQIRTEIKEDLEALQAIYNDLVMKLAAKDAFQDGHAREVAVKINKHAERLKTNIPFPKPPERETPPNGADDLSNLRQQIRTVCTAIYDLLTNPTIENIGLVDPEKSQHARESLDRIIIGTTRLVNGS